MAKPSKLDRAIDQAKQEVLRCETNLLIAARVLAGLQSAKVPDEEAVPKVKRTRKKKGLPTAGEVTQ